MEMGSKFEDLRKMDQNGLDKSNFKVCHFYNDDKHLKGLQTKYEYTFIVVGQTDSCGDSGQVYYNELCKLS